MKNPRKLTSIKPTYFESRKKILFRILKQRIEITLTPIEQRVFPNLLLQCVQVPIIRKPICKSTASLHILCLIYLAETGYGCNSRNIIETVHDRWGVQGKGYADESRHGSQSCVRFRAVIKLAGRPIVFCRPKVSIFWEFLHGIT